MSICLRHPFPPPQVKKEKTIIIKPCDMGAGIIILDYEVYFKACYEHLFLVQKNEGEPPKLYFTNVNDAQKRQQIYSTAVRDKFRLWLGTFQLLQYQMVWRERRI